MPRARIAFLCSLALAACQAQPPASPTPPAETTPAPAPAPVTTHGSATPTLPPGHPSVSGAKQPAPPLGQPPSAPQGGLDWTVPATWTAETPSSTMRKAQYKVPGQGGDGECVVFYFGPGQGGDPASNAQRWAEQFTPPPGTPAGQHAKTSERDVNGKKVLIVEAKGTYGGGMAMGTGGPATAAKSGYMLLAAIVPGADANWFFKLTGPEATVEANRKAFDALLVSIK